MDKKMYKAPIVKRGVEKTAAERGSIEKNANAGGLVSAMTKAELVDELRKARQPFTMKNVAMVAGGLTAAGMVAAGVNALARAGYEAYVSSGKNSVIAEATKINPRLASYPPAELQKYYALISEASPSVAKNPLLVANYLEYLLNHDGSINFMGYKQLLDIEGQQQRNKTDGSLINPNMHKPLFESVGRTFM